MPFYLYRTEHTDVIVPDPIEKTIWYVWPVYLLFSHVTFYFDLYLDVFVARQYWRDGGCTLPWNSIVQLGDEQVPCTNYAGDCDMPRVVHVNQCHDELVPGANRKKQYYFLYSVLFFFVGVLVTCLFDSITTLTTAEVSPTIFACPIFVCNPHAAARIESAGLANGGSWVESGC